MTVAIAMHRGSVMEEEDRISSLPDSILLHILSFLPMKDAVKTVLLRRFGTLWTNMQTLDFDGRSYNNLSVPPHNERFTYFVNRVLLQHEYPAIFKFSLKFGSLLYFTPNDLMPRRRHPKPLTPMFACNITSWICFAIKKKVKVLDLGILAHGSSTTRFEYELPNIVLTSDSVTELNLVNIGLRRQGEIRMRSLKTLSLTTIMLSNAIIEEILSGCPLLESISIIKCHGLHKLKCSSPYLKNLTVVLGESEISRLEISGSSLLSLHIAGYKGHVDLENLSSLVEATLDLYFKGIRAGDRCYRDVGMLIEKLHHAKTFVISNWCILVLTLWELTNVPCPSSSRKCLVLKTMLTKWHLPGISNLLRSSPNLEMLSIYIDPSISVSTIADDLRLEMLGSQYANYWDDESLLKLYDFDESNYWNYQRPFDCLANHLKTIKIFGSVSDSRAIQLVQFLLRSSVVLEKMVISMEWDVHANHQNHFQWGEKLELSRKLSSFPKASKDAVILFT